MYCCDFSIFTTNYQIRIYPRSSPVSPRQLKLRSSFVPFETFQSSKLGQSRNFGTGKAGQLVREASVLATERNFVSDIEKIATLAKDNAREQGARPS